ncbi:MAG: nuclear transport factor 2 family protein [Phycisphaerales bacterium]|nr:MAG: nuclear transport factor 2 family protein [Phycisphaerales bacterium]
MSNQITWFVVCVWATITAPSPIQEVGADQSQIGLRISAAKDGTYLLGEPVVVNVTLTNIGPGVASVSPDLSLLTSSAYYQISLNGQEFSDVDIGVHDEPSTRITKLHPGEEILHHETLLYDASVDGLLFPKAGEYHIRVKWYHPEQGHAVTSNDLAIVVRHPWDHEFEGMRVMANSSVAQVLLGLSSDSAGLQELEKVATTETPYAPYAALCLAQRELRRNELGMGVRQARAHRRKRLEKAMVLLDKADKQEFQLLDEVVFLKAQAYWDLGRHKEARAQFERVANDFPTARAGRKARELLRSMAEGRATTQEADSVPVAEPVDLQTRADVQSVIEQFLSAYAATDRNACGSFLSEDFVYNQVLKKRETLEEFQEDWDKLGGSTLTITTTDLALRKIGEEVGVTAHLVFRAGPASAPTGSTHPYSFILRKTDDTWLICSWNRERERSKTEP